MSTAKRFGLWLAGGLCICIGLAIVASPLSELLSDPHDVDFPGGAFGIAALILVAGSAPLVLGVRLILKARRGGQPVRAPREVVGREPTGATEIEDPHIPGPQTVSLSPLRRPAAVAAALLTTAGLAAATVLLGVPAMLIWRRASGIVGMAALTVFSVGDPMRMAFQRSWWLNALVSASTWTLLLIVFGGAANAIEPMREGAMIFLFPMMVFAGALGLSGVVRFVRWAGAPAKTDVVVN